MKLIIDKSQDDAKKKLCEKGYSVETREDMLEIKHNGLKVLEIVYFPGSSVLYSLTKEEEDIQCCNLKKAPMVFIYWFDARICINVVKQKEGNIFIQVSIHD